MMGARLVFFFWLLTALKTQASEDLIEVDWTALISVLTTSDKVSLINNPAEDPYQRLASRTDVYNDLHAVRKTKNKHTLNP
ncbi:hypothetical protein DNTS_022732 [Danionella cerebrum]|uniref:Uncharacterized protein n=1 Tax=Danionella cerebrum TaxID=2873325 RepID=A0A553MY32_9TELE|nr:hypothetical protein DNTS_022732 [Danionella translucida]TRY58101.1 hypothetical protein DNTS_022732 [Danionella translucida]